MTQTVIVKRERLTLDLLLFQAYGAAGQDLLVAATALNPGLAPVGPVIPLGTNVVLPDLPARDQFTARPLVTLFG